MQYMRLGTTEREEFLASLEGMPGYLTSAFSGLNPEQVRARGPEDIASPVEQVWHLADLEREGFGRRIARLLVEAESEFPDFNGARVAEERNYRSLSLEDGLAAFKDARLANVSSLRAIDDQSWFRSGTQEGVGRVALCDIPGFMFQHDVAHRNEIEAWLSAATK